MDERGTISSPITSLTELLNLSDSPLKHRFVSKPLVARTGSPREKVLLCHDMKGGYLQDKCVNGRCWSLIKLHWFRPVVLDIHKDVKRLNHAIASFDGI